MDCRDTNCCNENHRIQTKLCYDNLCKRFTDSSKDVLGTNNKKPYECKPGFNDHIKDLHDITRKCFVARREANKLKDHNNPFFKKMTVPRAKFKLALRYIKRHEYTLRKDAISNALRDNRGGKLWKEIKKISPNNIPLPISIDDATGKQEVTNM